MSEQWKKIKYFPQYWISDFGQVYSIKSKRMLKIRYTKAYPNGIVYLSNPNRNIYKQIISVDKLVIRAFTREFNEIDKIEHKDHNNKNNKLSNLKIISLNESSRDYCYILINQISLNSKKYKTLKEVHDFFNLSSKTTSALKSLQKVAKNRGYELKKIEGACEFKIKNESKRNLYHQEVLRFAEYIDEKYPEGKAIDKKDPIVIKHYKFMKNWDQ